MNLSGSYGIVLANRGLPSIAEVQREIDRKPCLFAPTLLALKPGPLACQIRVRDRVVRFGYETGPVDEVLALRHASLARDWSHAIVFRDDGSTIGGSLAGMVGEAAARAMGGVLYDRDRGIIPDYGDLIYWLDAFLSVDFDDLEAYYRRYPDERPRARAHAEPVRIETRVFRGP